jgi:hypothetical protein
MVLDLDKLLGVKKPVSLLRPEEDAPKKDVPKKAKPKDNKPKQTKKSAIKKATTKPKKKDTPAAPKEEPQPKLPEPPYDPDTARAGFKKVSSEKSPAGASTLAREFYEKTSKKYDTPEADADALRAAQQRAIDNKILLLNMLKMTHPERSDEVDAAIARLRGPVAPTPAPAAATSVESPMDIPTGKESEQELLPPLEYTSPEEKFVYRDPNKKAPIDEIPAAPKAPEIPTPKKNMPIPASPLKWRDDVEAYVREKTGKTSPENLIPTTPAPLYDTRGAGVKERNAPPELPEVPPVELPPTEDKSAAPSTSQVVRDKLGVSDSPTTASLKGVDFPSDTPDLPDTIREKVMKDNISGQKVEDTKPAKVEDTKPAKDPYARYDTAKTQAAKDSATAYSEYLAGLDAASRSKMVDRIVGALGQITAGAVGLGKGLDVAKHYKYEPTVDEAELRDVAKEKLGYQKGEAERKLNLAQKGHEEFTKRISEIMGRTPEEAELDKLLATRTKGKVSTDVEPMIQDIRKERVAAPSQADQAIKGIADSLIQRNAGAAADAGAASGGSAGGGTKAEFPAKINNLPENTAAGFSSTYSKDTGSSHLGRVAIYDSATDTLDADGKRFDPASHHAFSHDVLRTASLYHTLPNDAQADDEQLKNRYLAERLAVAAGYRPTTAVMYSTPAKAPGGKAPELATSTRMSRQYQGTPLIKGLKGYLMSSDKSHRDAALNTIMKRLDVGEGPARVIARMITDGKILDVASK